MGSDCKKMASPTAADCMKLEKMADPSNNNNNHTNSHKANSSAGKTSTNTKLESELGFEESDHKLVEEEDMVVEEEETSPPSKVVVKQQLSTTTNNNNNNNNNHTITTNLKIWGCRGSIPRSEPNMIKYGGATSCVEFVSAKGTRVILDMGSGSYQLGQEMIQKFFSGQKGQDGGSILISHTHWDHIQGFPFFVPLFIPKQSWDVYGPRGAAGSIRESLAGQMQYDYFPINLDYLGAQINYQDLNEGTFYLGGHKGPLPTKDDSAPVPPSLSSQMEDSSSQQGGEEKEALYCQEVNHKKGDVRVSTHYLNHPCLTLGYRVTDTTTNVTVCYITDHEPYDHRMGKTGYKPSKPHTQPTADDKHVAFIKGADLLFHDAQYTAEQYTQKVTWGHSTVEYVVDVALAAGVKKLGLFHHDPMRTDEQVEELVVMAQQRIRDSALAVGGSPSSKLQVFAAYDRQELQLEGHVEKNPNDQEGMSKRASLSSTASDLIQSMWEKNSQESLTALVDGKESSENDEEPSAFRDSRRSTPNNTNNSNVVGGGSSSSSSRPKSGGGKKVINGSGLTENHHNTETMPSADGEEEEYYYANGTTAAPSSDRIMLVFSDSSEAQPISQQLQIGHPVDVFSTGKEAMENALQDKPALITVQKTIDGSISGLDLCKMIRSEMGDWGRNVPILMQVGSQQGLEDIRDVGQEVGVTDWLAKPYSPEYVRTKIRIAMLRTPCRWIKADVPKNEPERLHALRSTNLLDTDSEDRFDRITRIAARAFDVPTCLVSLVDEHRQWFKSCQGLCATETHRDQAFCAHAILQEDVFVVSDALKDDRFADNPLVTGAPYVRFYAGVPLKVKDTGFSLNTNEEEEDVTKGMSNLRLTKNPTDEKTKWTPTSSPTSSPRLEGCLNDPRYQQVGTLCLIDSRPRNLDDEELQMLRDMGAMVEQELQKSLESGIPYFPSTKNNTNAENNKRALTA